MYIAGCYVIATFALIVCLYPLLYTLFVSLCTEDEWIARNGLLLFFPSNPSFAAYIKIFGTGSYVLRAAGISLARTVAGTVLGVALTAAVGYVLSREELPGRKVYTYIILFTIFFSGGLIPTYMVVKEMNLINSFWSMVIPPLISTWNVLIFRQFFTGLPKDIVEAAKVDGVNEAQMLYKIILPMSKSVFAAIGLFTVVGHWNSWFDALIYIDVSRSDIWPLQLYTMINFNNVSQINEGRLQDIQGALTGRDISPLGIRMALTIVTFLPVLIVYPFFQKYFTKGVYLGAVKG